MKVGERFELQSCVIEITRVRESLKAADEDGRPRSLWIAEFTRHEEEKPMLLRSSPPAHADHEEVTDLDAFAIKRAAAESAYTSSEFAAMPNEPESVGPDWVDAGKAEREAKRQEAQMEVQQQRQAQAAKSRLNRLLAGAKTPEQTQLLLAGIVALCEQAEAGDMKEAA